METAYYIVLNIKTPRGFESFARFYIGNRDQVARHLFDKLKGSEAEVDATRQEIRALMDQFGAQELQQERLERMFAIYNAHWSEYYGTDKVFTVH